MWLLTTETQLVGNLLFSHRLGLLRNISRISLRFVNSIKKMESFEVGPTCGLNDDEFKNCQARKRLTSKNDGSST